MLSFIKSAIRTNAIFLDAHNYCCYNAQWQRWRGGGGLFFIFPCTNTSLVCCYGHRHCVSV